MKSTPLFRYLSCALCCLLLGLSSSLYADSNESSSSSGASLTQGQAAVVVARRLGLLSGPQAPTEANAVQLLSARSIAPRGGWDVGETLTTGTLARLLVQALGLEEELSEAEIAGDDEQPYIDMLIEKYGVDLSEMDVDEALSDNAFGSEDPLAMEGAGEGPGQNNVLGVTRSRLNQVLDAITGSAGGGGGTSGSPSGAAPTGP